VETSTISTLKPTKLLGILQRQDDDNSKKGTTFFLIKKINKNMLLHTIFLQRNMEDFNWELILVSSWLLIEFLWYLYYSYRRNKIQRQIPFNSSFSTRKIRNEIIDQVLSTTSSLSKHHSAYNIHKFLQGWFLQKNPTSPINIAHEIHEDNVKELLVQNLWGKASLKQLDSREQEEMEFYIERVKQHILLPEGRNPDIKPMDNRLDPVQIQHRPWIFYLVFFLLRTLGEIVLWILGFIKIHHGQIVFWRKRMKSDKNPLVFLHGIGIGPLTYLRFLSKVRNRDVVIVEMPWVGLNLFKSIPTEQDFVKDFESFFKKQFSSKCCVCAHSYGTFAFSWIVKHNPSMISGAVLIDPPALLLFLPDVCANFLHFRKARNLVKGIKSQEAGWNAWLLQIKRTTFLLILHLFARELSIAESLTRRFTWINSYLPLHHAPEQTFVFLSEDDLIVPVEEIDHILKEEKRRGNSKIHVEKIERLAHGEFLGHRFAKTILLRHLDRMD
jgi:pimeloyl-ACP methyl ester carboxylesterase